MQKGDGTYRRAKDCETAVSKAHHPLRFCGFSANAFPPLDMSFLNFVLVSAGCSYSLTVSSITMVMERLGKYFMRTFQIPLC